MAANPHNVSATVGEETIAETALAAGVLGCEMADIAGTIDDVHRVARSQTERFADVVADVGGIVRSNERIRSAAKEAVELAADARDRVGASLTAAVDHIETGLAAVGTSLDGAVDATNEIAQIAMQTRMVALNASIQAAHAGAAGSSFAVVAVAVRDLSEKIQHSSKTIALTLTRLSDMVRSVTDASGAPGSGAATGLRGSVGTALEAFREQFDTVAARLAVLAEAADKTVADCARIDQSARGMAAEVATVEKSIAQAAKKSERLLGVSERLIEVTARSGARTDDTAFIERARAAAAELSAQLEAAVAAGEIALQDLFDERYVPVAGSDPAQFTTRYLAVTDRRFPAIQEAVLGWSDRVAFCAAVDRNGYLPTHNLRYSKPQRADSVWNAANCRNRRLFQDRAGLAAGRNTKPFLVQTYRRDMGGGSFAILKEVDVPIVVRERQWGNLRLAFRPLTA